MDNWQLNVIPRILMLTNYLILKLSNNLTHYPDIYGFIHTMWLLTENQIKHKFTTQNMLHIMNEMYCNVCCKNYYNMMLLIAFITILISILCSFSFVTFYLSIFANISLIISQSWKDLWPRKFSMFDADSKPELLQLCK